MEKINNSLNIIRTHIAEACAKFGRNPADVEILCAAKNRTTEELDAVYSAGVTVFGENRVQEFNANYNPNYTWDIIGQLQTNKVKYVVGKVRYIHSLDRLPLALEIEKLAEKRGIVQKCLIEINSGAEEAKGGILLSEAEGFIEELKAYPHIEVCGLMAVAPKASEEDLRKLFSGVAAEYKRLKASNNHLTCLSMGMSGDYKLAVECGSTMVRLGRIMFE